MSTLAKFLRMVKTGIRILRFVRTVLERMMEVMRQLKFKYATS